MTITIKCAQRWTIMGSLFSLVESVFYHKPQPLRKYRGASHLAGLSCCITAKSGKHPSQLITTMRLPSQAHVTRREMAPRPTSEIRGANVTKSPTSSQKM